MSSIDEQVIDFYYELFDRIFTQPFRPTIKERLRRDAVSRQIEEAAGAASQALARFFLSEQLTESQVAEILHGFTSLHDLVKLEDIANPNRTPEALVEELVKNHPCPIGVSTAGSDAVYRVALHLTIQVLMLVGPVMTEWQRLTFSTTYEMPRRIVSQLNQITEGLKAFAGAGQAAADERYELAYRDHLLQRFYRVEAGTVQMTTNLNVDLRELFVMPSVAVREDSLSHQAELDPEKFMDLSAARAIFGPEKLLKPLLPPITGPGNELSVPPPRAIALEQVRLTERTVVIGVPGSGKSTFFEWLQLSIANVDEELVAGGAQAVPLLLRVRELDPKNLPRGAGLIEKATASRDRAVLMPDRWIHRYMKAGRILFMLDGLDETDPGVRDDYILPWLAALCKKYPDCRYLISSRPVGYPPGTLCRLGFVECDLKDFEDPEIGEYARHWCTAIRLARNDPEEEARREGAKEGDEIVAGFKHHPYIRNLARNPLMLSGICLVNYFERGQLPKDRVVLYKLCVEGLLHHWDQRRGIRSEYSLNEKLRVCREVAIAMQADDRAEYEESKVLSIIAVVLRDDERAAKLLDHIRYRTGLLIERRSGVFAFAHLTFQEYLAASAVYEGNHLRIEADQLAVECGDARWKEVIALYCGLSSANAARAMIERLIEQPDNDQFAEVLAEAFLSSSSDLLIDKDLRARVLKRIAIAPRGGQLNRFTVEEAALVASEAIGQTNSKAFDYSQAFWWLLSNAESINKVHFAKLLKEWRTLSSSQLFELVYLTHSRADDEWLGQITIESGLYEASGVMRGYETQAEVALNALGDRRISVDGSLQPAWIDKVFLEILRVLAQKRSLNVYGDLRSLIHDYYPTNTSMWPEFILLSRKLARRFQQTEITVPDIEFHKRAGQDLAVDLLAWADRLETRLREENIPQPRRPTRKPTKRRRKA